MTDGRKHLQTARRAFFDDWSACEFTDRERLAREVDARQPFPLRRHVRVSHMVRFYPSASDVLRRRLVSTGADELKAEGLYDTEVPARNTRTIIEREIFKLADCARGRASTDQAGKLLEEMQRIDPDEHGSYPADAERQFGKLRALFEEGGALDATDDNRSHVSPFHPGGQRQRCWLNFWRRSPDSDPKSTLRLYWEGYRGNQNFSVLEDFDSGIGSDQPSPFLTADKVDFSKTALDGYLADLNFLAPDIDFKWVGDMITTTHIWVVPAAQAIYGVTEDKERTHRVIRMLRRHFLKEPLEEHPEHLEELRTALILIAEAYFGAEDPTRADNLDLNCAITRLADGRAFMFSDRVHSSRDRGAPERRVIIFDIAMNDDERGRVVKNLCDLFTYHTLAQRDYPSIIELRHVIAAIQEELGAISAEFGQASDAMLSQSKHTKLNSPIGDRLDRSLNRLHRLTAVLGAADVFVMDGVHAAAKTGRSFLRLQNDRITAIQPRAFSDFRGLDAITGPFASVIGVLEEVSEQFGHCEERLSDLTNLISATLERQHARQVEDLTRKNNRASLLAAAAALLAVGLTGYEILKRGTPEPDVVLNQADDRAEITDTTASEVP